MQLRGTTGYKHGYKTHHKLGYGARIMTMAKYIQEQFTGSIWKCTSKHWSPCPWQIRCCNRAGSVPSFVMLRSLIRQWLITAGSIKWNKPDNIRKTRKTWNKWKEHIENPENKQHQSKGHGGEQKNNSRHIKKIIKRIFSWWATVRWTFQFSQ